MKLETGLMILAVFSTVALTAAGIMAENTDRKTSIENCHGPGYGYNGPMHGIYGYGNTAFLKKELNLSENQVKKITEINSSFRVKYDINRGDRDRMWKTRKDHAKAIEGVLTKKQLQKLESNNYYCSGGDCGPGWGRHHRGWHHRGGGY